MTIAEYDDGSAPLLDSSVLDRLREELDDDEGVWKVFIQDFVAQLPSRTEKLRLALTTGDSVGAMVAVLSLKTSSQMVGAERLADLVLELENLLRVECSGRDPAVVLPRLAAGRLVQIKECAQQTRYFLQRHL
ncbi:HPt (histidine-containing phosphotransfer) domain-containing protein [Pseudarthrobacter sp. W1I19]|uniref:Hpt domain-containing protein n=1 Tax=Pseudarthrobacter sp. W1I19 TaxID=3042288 RepID=UPI002785687B|nr:Hpt domain-containing protein [Pseudarthrobacter sp. W1I19]MDQ0922374.1 HPt (histidine-containing phosphotransfer) domain-containing protein [Pseudarthrobacter sp. W1I19]